MRGTAPSNLVRAAVLAAVLLAAQTFALIHAEANDSHPADEVCVLCVGLATFSAGNVAIAQPGLLVMQQVGQRAVVAVQSPARRVERQLPRGPPQAF